MSYRPYAWIIDRDYIEPERKTQGPRRPDPTLTAQIDAGKGEPFRMYDDDGELYYEGRIVIADGTHIETRFAPLDDFGRPNAGATEIQYQVGKRWVRL